MNKSLYSVIIVDRSGSMQGLAKEATVGINSTIETLKKLENVKLHLVEFDTVYNVVYTGDPKAAPKYELLPRGGTALLDAVGRTINEVGKHLSFLSEKERPELVDVLIVTDGQENSSRDFRPAQVKEMIKHQTEKYKWNFTYLSSDLSAVQEAHSLGIWNAYNVSNDVKGIQSVYVANAQRISSYSVTGDQKDTQWTAALSS